MQHGEGISMHTGTPQNKSKSTERARHRIRHAARPGPACDTGTLVRLLMTACDADVVCGAHHVMYASFYAGLMS